MRIFNCLILFTAILFVGSCDISDNDIPPENSFLKIYDHSLFEASFIPLDVKQTSDGGYLVLGSTRVEDSDFTGVYLLKVDQHGEFVMDQNLSTDYIHPVKSLMDINGTYYFLAMSNIDLQAHLFSVDVDGNIIDTVPVGGLTYPSAAEQDGDNIILLCYNNADKTSNIRLINTSGDVVGGGSSTFTIGEGEDVEVPIIQHFTRTGKQLPFAVGRTSNGMYYFNGFYNYTMSLVFTDLTDDSPNGVAQGQQNDGGLSAVANLSGNTFAVSRFNFGDNYLLPRVTIDASSITSSISLGGNPFPELVSDAPIIVKQIQTETGNMLIYASNTRGGQIVLLSYSPDTGALEGTRYLGFGNPYQVSSFASTEDNGLVVIGSTHVAGRFGRICLFKLSEQELNELSD